MGEQQNFRDLVLELIRELHASDGAALVRDVEARLTAPIAEIRRALKRLEEEGRIAVDDLPGDGHRVRPLDARVPGRRTG
jgi:DNA-binding GntR family transcriptional regulator